MPETFSNLLSTTTPATLGVSINSSVTSLSVSSGATFPASGTFSILIDSELMTVAAVSGTTFTVVRGEGATTAASHSSGANVVPLITSRVLGALQDAVNSGGAAIASGVTGGTDLLSLTWKQTGTFGPFSLHSDFVLLDERFEFDASGRYSVLFNNSGSTTWANGTFGYQGVAAAYTAMYPPGITLRGGMTISCDVKAWAGGAADQAFVGLGADASHYLQAIADHNAGTVSLFDAGTSTTLFSVSQALTPPFTLLLVASGKHATVAVDFGTGPKFIGVAPFNLFQTSTQATLHPFFGTYSTANAQVQLTRFRVTHPGLQGIGNPRLIKNLDGTPLVRDGLAYLTGTACGFGANEGPQAVFQCDPATGNFKTTAYLYTVHDTWTATDSPMSLHYDPGTNRFLVLVSGWSQYLYGDGSVDVLYQWCSENLLGGVHYLSELQTLALPSRASHSYYDTDILYTGGTWKLAATQTAARTGWGAFHAGLFTSSDFATWTTSFVDPTGNTEGTQFTTVNNTTYVVAGISGATTVNVYAMNSSGTPLGTITGLVSATPAAHPVIFALPFGSKTEYYLMSHDIFSSGFAGAAGGFLQVFRANEAATGFEFAQVSRL